MSDCLHCDRPAHLRGLCIAHYRRFMIYGNALEPWHRPVMGTCSECDRPAVAKDLCNAHYKKLRKYGDPLGFKPVLSGLARLDRYLSYVDQRGPEDCWPWTGGGWGDGYGAFNAGGTGSAGAHRYGFTQLVRPLKPGETVDHICHNRDPHCPGGNTCEHRACQNPAHWEAVPGVVNVARGKSVPSANARKVKCKWGHDLTPENCYGYEGRRVCKTCARLAARGQHPRQLAAAGRLF